jgi:hypothetical protein
MNLANIVHHAVEQPLGVHLALAAQRETVESPGAGDVGKHWLDEPKGRKERFSTTLNPTAIRGRPTQAKRRCDGPFHGLVRRHPFKRTAFAQLIVANETAFS